MPAEMRALIEDYNRVSPRLYQIANHFRDAARTPRRLCSSGQCRDQGADQVPVQHSGDGRELQAARGRDVPAGSPQQKAANEADQDKEDPVFFAKSPRSCIIDPGEPFLMPPGRNIDWEGELAIVIGKPALQRDRSDRRTTTCSATASCTTSAIAAAPAAR